MKKITVVIITVSALVLAGCESVLTRQDQGALLGGAAGAAIGHNFGSGSGKVLATFAGAVLGVIAGSRVGARLDGYDELQAQRALEYNKTGDTLAWTNPDSEKEVEFTPTHTFQDPDSGRYCREYTTAVNVGGQTEEAYGTACRQPDGSWRIIN